MIGERRKNPLPDKFLRGELNAEEAKELSERLGEERELVQSLNFDMKLNAALESRRIEELRQNYQASARRTMLKRLLNWSIALCIVALGVFLLWQAIA